MDPQRIRGQHMGRSALVRSTGIQRRVLDDDQRKVLHGTGIRAGRGGRPRDECLPGAVFLDAPHRTAPFQRGNVRTRTAFLLVETDRGRDDRRHPGHFRHHGTDRPGKLGRHATVFQSGSLRRHGPHIQSRHRLFRILAADHAFRPVLAAAPGRGLGDRRYPVLPLPRRRHHRGTRHTDPLLREEPRLCPGRHRLPAHGLGLPARHVPPALFRIGIRLRRGLYRSARPD